MPSQAYYRRCNSRPSSACLSADKHRPIIVSLAHQVFRTYQKQKKRGLNLYLSPYHNPT
jgi:hypothetical protein